MNEGVPITTQETVARSQRARATALAAVLGRVEAALESTVGAASPLLGRFRVLQRRLDQEHLQLAVLGQFKRGKSTFINALLGADLLPTGVIPVTAVASFIAWRGKPLVRVRFRDDKRAEEFDPQTTDGIREVLFRFVAEEANPKNYLEVERVELFYPAGILADGTVIIDTPGVGSTLKHNTEAAVQLLPECDAAFFVLSADPPITEIELDYLRRLKVRTARVFFILNKADMLSSDEQRTAVQFLHKVLGEHALIDADGLIFCISARHGLVAKQTANETALRASAISAVEDYLVSTLAKEKSHWLEEAVRSKVADILTQTLGELELRVCALNMPIEKLAAKSDEFGQALSSIEEQRRIVRDLLAGEHRRLREALDSRIIVARKEIAAKLASVIDTSLTGTVPMVWEEAARRAVAEGIEVEFEAAREPFVSIFAADASSALRACHDRINALIDRVRQTAAEIFDVALEANTEHDGFELGEDPYWVTEDIGASLIPDPSRLIDRLLPARLRRSRLRARMIRQADQLIVRNAENLRWAIVRGLDETFRKAAAEFEERLDQTIAATRDVIKDALVRRREQSFAVAPELERFAAAMASLNSLRKELCSE